MAISWCKNRKQLVSVAPGSPCPVCGKKTVALNVMHTAGILGRTESADMEFALRDITKTGILKLSSGKVKAGMIGSVVLAKAGGRPLEDVFDLMTANRIKLGTPVRVKGTLATAGTDRILFVDSIGKKPGGGGISSLKSARPGLGRKV